MEDDRRQFLENAAGVFHTMSLLEIRKSFRMLTELEPALIENFVERYSDFIIFLLNILDSGRANELLARLPDSSLVYIAEEELRSLMIREVGALARAGGDFAGLSLFLDLIDRPGGASGPLPDFAATVLREGARLRASAPRRYFAALDNVGGERRTRAMELITRRNPAVALGLMIYASDAVLFAALDQIALERPELLAELPEEWFRERFREDYSAYVRPEALAHLPRAIRELLQAREQFLKRENGALSEIRRLLAEEPPGAARRRKILDIAYGLTGRVATDIAGLLLQDLRREGALESEDIELIRRVRDSGETR